MKKFDKIDVALAICVVLFCVYVFSYILIRKHNTAEVDEAEGCPCVYVYMQQGTTTIFYNPLIYFDKKLNSRTQFIFTRWKHEWN